MRTGQICRSSDRDVQDIVYAWWRWPTRSRCPSRASARSLGEPAVAAANFNRTWRGELLRPPRRLAAGSAPRRRLRVPTNLCLLFGQGRYAIRGGELELIKIRRAVKADLHAGMEFPDQLSPAGEPPDEPLVQRGGRNPFLWVSLAMFAVAIAVFVGCASRWTTAPARSTTASRS